MKKTTIKTPYSPYDIVYVMHNNIIKKAQIVFIIIELEAETISLTDKIKESIKILVRFENTIDNQFHYCSKSDLVSFSPEKVFSTKKDLIKSFE